MGERLAYHLVVTSESETESLKLLCRASSHDKLQYLQRIRADGLPRTCVSLVWVVSYWEMEWDGLL